LYVQGILQPDMWGVTPSNFWDWGALREMISKTGVRNSLLVAPMPTASTSQILGNNECFEPYTSNIYNRRVLRYIAIPYYYILASHSALSCLLTLCFSVVNLLSWTSIFFTTWLKWDCGILHLRIRLSMTMVLYRIYQKYPTNWKAYTSMRFVNFYLTKT
jgi:hypothetical protein